MTQYELLENRRLRCIPWPIDVNSAYRNPSIEEASDTYGITGEAVAGLFERLDDDARERVLQSLQKVLPFRSGYFSALFLGNAGHCYTNEFWFYFVHFVKHELGENLIPYLQTGEGPAFVSKDHKIFEKDGLEYQPFGKGVDDVTNAVNVGLLKLLPDDTARSEYLSWIDLLTL